MQKRYRVAVIGSTGRGNYGHGLDTVWKDVPRTELVAIADDNAEGLARALERTAAPKGYADYREMLDREQPDIVSLAPRWLDRHAEFAFAAIERGCHLYMEKPFCRDLEEADAIVNAAEMRHIKIAIAHQTRWTPPLDVATREIKNGIIGRVLELRARGKEDPRRGGGEDLWVLGSHVLDLMRVFAGNPHSCHARVLQKSRPITKADVINGAEGIGPLAGDTVDAMYTFDGGILGYFSSRRGTAPNEGRFALQIFGSDGMMEIVPGHLGGCYVLRDPTWSPGRSKQTWQTITSQGIDQPEPLPNTSLHGGNILAVNDLLDCIEDPAHHPRCNMYDGRWTVEMIAGVFESQRLDETVALPLKNRKNPLMML